MNCKVDFTEGTFSHNFTNFVILTLCRGWMSEFDKAHANIFKKLLQNSGFW